MTLLAAPTFQDLATAKKRGLRPVHAIRPPAHVCKSSNCGAGRVQVYANANLSIYSGRALQCRLPVLRGGVAAGLARRRVGHAEDSGSQTTNVTSAA